MTKQKEADLWRYLQETQSCLVVRAEIDWSSLNSADLILVPRKDGFCFKKSKLTTHIYLLFLPNFTKMTVKEEQMTDFHHMEKKGIGGGVTH